MSVRVHMVEQHVEEFIEMKGEEFGKYISTCFCKKMVTPFYFVTSVSQELRKVGPENSNYQEALKKNSLRLQLPILLES